MTERPDALDRLAGAVLVAEAARAYIIAHDTIARMGDESVIEAVDRRFAARNALRAAVEAWEAGA